MRGIINAGYKARATVPRIEGEDRHVEFYEVYSPKCLASTRGLGAVMEDRCITIIMLKPYQDDLRQNRAVDPSDPEWATIRDGFYQLPLTYSDGILQGQKGANFPSWLRARDRELWAPLLQLASVVDRESGLGVFADILDVAKESLQDKGLTFETEAILGLLESELVGMDTKNIHPVDLVEGLESALNKRGRVSPQWIAGRLRGLGFKKGDPPRDNKGVIYEIHADKLSDIRCRYEESTQQSTQP